MMRCQARSSQAGLSLDEDRGGGDRLTAAGKLAQRRRFEIAEDGQRHGPRYRRRGHHQQMRRDTGRCLGPQLVSLLDPEPVLLVDDHHAELVELDRVLQQRVRADDDADLAAGDLGADLLLLRRRHRAGQQRQPGRVVLAAELAAHRQRPEHIADRPKMLCGKDFGGRQQRALIAGVDHLQHRQHRDDGLARAHFALQEPVHRPGRRQLAGEHVEHLALTGGQLERQALQQFVLEAGRRRRRRRAGLGQFAVASTHQRPLQAHRLVEGQPFTGPPPVGVVLGQVDRAQRLVLGSQIVCGTELLGQRIGHRIEHVEHLPNAVEDVPALQLRAGRIDRVEGALERLLQHFPAHRLRGVGDHLQRPAAVVASVGGVRAPGSRDGSVAWRRGSSRPRRTT